MWSSMFQRILPAFYVVSIFLSNTAFGNNVCYVEQGGCRYRVTILPTSVCPAISGYGHNNDQPIDGSTLLSSTSAATADDIESSSKAGSQLPGSGQQDNVLDPVKKLENLESKLLKMVEELSVRSLRHIREIRTDLRQMAVSVNSLKSPSGGGGRMTMTRSGGNAGGGHAGGGAASDMVGSQATAGGRIGGGIGMQCPSEFVGVGTWRSCYRFSNFEASWHEAREYCSAFGANLVSIDTMKEAYIVDYLIKSHQGMFIARPCLENGVNATVE